MRSVFVLVLVLAAPSSFAADAIPVSTAKAATVTLREHARDFQACQEENFQRSKKHVSGRVNLRIVLDKSGKVLEAGPAKNTTHSRFIADCLVRIVGSIRFDPQRTKRVIIYPVRFRSGKPGPGEKVVVKKKKKAGA